MKWAVLQEDWCPMRRGHKDTGRHRGATTWGYGEDSQLSSCPGDTSPAHTSTLDLSDLSRLQPRETIHVCSLSTPSWDICSGSTSGLTTSHHRVGTVSPGPWGDFGERVLTPAGLSVFTREPHWVSPRLGDKSVPPQDTKARNKA